MSTWVIWQLGPSADRQCQNEFAKIAVFQNVNTRCMYMITLQMKTFASLLFANKKGDLQQLHDSGSVAGTLWGLFSLKV